MTSWNKDVLRCCVLASLFLVQGEGLAGQPGQSKKQPAEHVDRLRRAGNPHAVAWYAKPSLNKHYRPYYVGGGAVIGGHPRAPDEGTWGMDYVGAILKRRVWLRWWHGRHEQDGGGSYTTDGPHLPRH